jgi:isopenicillin N synthase-like dioxygenase
VAQLAAVAGVDCYSQTLPPNILYTRFSPRSLQAELNPHGLADILAFFTAVTAHHVPQIITSLIAVAGRELAPLHTKLIVNFRLIDYTPVTASPDSQNGCGAHTDYGTFSIIFQDGTAGLEMEAPEASVCRCPCQAMRLYYYVGSVQWC